MLKKIPIKRSITMTAYITVNNIVNAAKNIYNGNFSLQDWYQHDKNEKPQPKSDSGATSVFITEGPKKYTSPFGGARRIINDIKKVDINMIGANGNYSRHYIFNEIPSVGVSTLNNTYCSLYSGLVDQNGNGKIDKNERGRNGAVVELKICGPNSQSEVVNSMRIRDTGIMFSSWKTLSYLNPALFGPDDWMGTK